LSIRGLSYKLKDFFHSVEHPIDLFSFQHFPILQRKKVYRNLNVEMGAVSEDVKNGDPEQVHLYNAKRAKAPNNSLTKWCLNGTKFLSSAL
jgi:hypothetical protein